MNEMCPGSHVPAVHGDGGQVCPVCGRVFRNAGRGRRGKSAWQGVPHHDRWVADERVGADQGDRPATG